MREPSSEQADVWIFGYGSLIWMPGFSFVERMRASLPGFRRAFCMSSVHYRGTPEAPGLVLALDLDPDGACAGVAYRVPSHEADATMAYLRARELVSSAYDEVLVPVTLEDGRVVDAFTYVVNRTHIQYRGGLDRDTQAAIIARAAGPAGPNAEYLFNTVSGLEALGLEDPELLDLADRVGTRLAAGPRGDG